MKFNGISWKMVSNNVTKRVVDHSLVHKLVRCRRLRRRTKVMNTAIKRFRRFKTYSQYVKMKTSVLRNLSEDSDTDSDSSSVNNDYNVLYKCDMPTTNCMIHVPTSNASCFSEEKTSSQQFKNTSSSIVNLELQENNKKENVNLSYFSRKNVHKIKPKKLNETDNYECLLSNIDSPVREKDVILKNQGTFTVKKCIKSNEITSGVIKKIQQTEKDDERSIEGGINIVHDINGKLDKEDCYKTLYNKNKLTDIEDNLMSLSNQDTVIHDVDTSFTNSKTNLQHNYFIHSIEDLRVDEGSVDETKSAKFLQMQSLLNDNRNQPKDSGIDEDTEEEFSENKKGNHVKEKEKIQKDCEIVELASPTLDCKNFSKVEANLTTANTCLSDTHDTSDITNFQSRTVFKVGNINNEGKQGDKLQKQKLSPKVTCTEIVSKKYRIVSRDASLFDSNTGSEVTDNCVDCEKIMESVEIEHNAEDSMSPLSKRRLQQLKRLNLTIDSDSSLSDDDNPYCNTENMRDKLFKRSKESSESLDSEDDSMIFKHTTLVTGGKNSQKNKICRFESNKKKKNIYLGETCTTGTEDEETFNVNESSRSLVRKINNSELTGNHILNSSIENKKYSLIDQYKESSQNSLDQDMYCSDNENNNSEENTKLNGSFQESQTIDKNFKIGTIKNPTMQRRPCNLQELLEKESLIHDIALPSVTLKDLEENDIYLLDVPSMVLKSKLLGRGFILTEKKLKLGKRKYKITLNDIGHVSCVFNTGESFTNYKAVTIKPIKRIVAYEKIDQK